MKRSILALLLMALAASGENIAVTFDTATGEIVNPAQLKIKTANSGTGAAPAITFGSNSNGFYWSSAGGAGIQIREGGVDILNFDSGTGMTAGSGLGITLTGGGIFTGSGSGLTALNATNLATGTVATGRISGPYTGINGLGTITVGTWNGTAIAPGFGGTGLTSYTIGDLIYASGATTLSKLAGVATGNALISGGVGTAPSFGKIGLTTHVSGTLPVGSGGSGTTTATGTAGSIVLSNAPTIIDLVPSFSAMSNIRTFREAAGIVTKRKSAGTSRTNNTVSADPDLQIAVGSGEQWAFQIFVHVNILDGAADFNGGLATPSVSALYYGIEAHQNVNILFGESNVATPSGGYVVNVASPANVVFKITGSLTTSASGTISLNWAQNATDTDATTVMPASYAIFTRLN